MNTRKIKGQGTMDIRHKAARRMQRDWELTEQSAFPRARLVPIYYFPTPDRPLPPTDRRAA